MRHVLQEHGTRGPRWVALLGEVWVVQPCWRKHATGAGFMSLTYVQFTLCFRPVVQDVNSASCSGCPASPAMMDSPSRTKAKINSSFRKSLLVMEFHHSDRRVIHTGSRDQTQISGFVKCFALNSQYGLKSTAIRLNLNSDTTQWKSRTNSSRLPSDLHTCAVSYTSPHRHKSINEKKKKF